MVLLDESHESISQEFIKHHLELTALIQDIQQCVGPLESLNELNASGRIKITNLRNSIERLENLAERERDKKRKTEIMTDVKNYQGQLTTAIAAFRKANVMSAHTIDKLAKEELLATTPEEQNQIRKRKDRMGAADISSRATQKLYDISKNLAETNYRSAETLDTLATSSEKVSSTRKELEQQQQVFVQSGKLLGKYGRREITDKALIILAFMFFLAVVFYILQKRLF